MKKGVAPFSMATVCILTFALTSCSFVISDGNGHTAAGSTKDVGNFFEEYWYIFLIVFVLFVIAMIIISIVVKKNGKK